MIWIDLIYNLAILVALSVISGFVDMRWQSRTLPGKLLQGLVFGIAVLIGMLRPFVYSPGLIFDGRSVMISLCAFFFGPWSAAIACLITSALRLSQGGPGTAMGISVILTSALIGLAFHYRKRKTSGGASVGALLLFGFIVHLDMLAMTVLLPPEQILPVLAMIAWPVLLIYPFATVLTGTILSNHIAQAELVDTLRKSEKRHRAILQTAMDGCILLDLQGHVLEVNGAYCRMSGYSESELLTLCVKDLDEAYSPAEIDAFLLRIQAQGEARLETRHRKKDGSLFDVALNVQYQDSQGGQLVVFVQDITERKAAEHALRSSQARYRKLLELAPMPLCHADSDGVIDFMNTRFVQVFGYTKEALPTIDQWWCSAYPDPDYRQRVRQIWHAKIKQASAGGREIEADEYRVTCANGEVRVVEISGIVMYDGVLVTFNDLTARKKAEEALLESEGRLLEAQRLAQLGHWIWDVKTGNVEWSDEVYKIFRLDPKVFAPHIDSILALSPWPQDHQRDQELIQKAIESHGKGSYEQRFLRPDKSIGYYFSTFQGKYNDTGDLVTIVGIIQDITERKLTEEFREMGQSALHILNEEGPLEDSISRVLSEIKNRTGFDAVGLRLQAGEDFPFFAQQGFSAKFLKTENTLVRRSANNEVERDGKGGVCLECTCGLVLSGKTNASLPIFTRGGSFWTNDSSFMGELPSEQELRVHPRNICILEGYASIALIPIRNRDRIVGLIQLSDKRSGCFTLNMIEILEGIAAQIGAALMRRRAEEVLRESEQKYRTIITASPVPIALNDGQQHITFLNPSFVQTFGYSLADIPSLDHWWSTAFPDKQNRKRIFEAWKAEIAQVQRTGSAFTPIEATIRCKDGTSRIVLASAAPLFGSFSDAHLIVFYDITEHKRAEGEIQNMQKLQSVGTLAGGIAHDFNNILQGLFGNISLAKEELSSSHPSYKFLEEAEKSMCRAIRLTKQLLTFSKGGEPVKEEVSLGTLVEEVARFDLSGSQVSLVYRQSDGLWQAQADKGQIQQVISNLIINARQAMPTGGHLYVTLENADLTQESIPGLRPGKYVKVTIRDEGTGIDPKFMSRIFDPYFTTKPTGTGLGLATVYSIVSKHNGAIRVESEPGKGATFTLHLPASQFAPNKQMVQAPPAEPHRPVAHARILIMDDEAPVRTLVTRILTSEGHTVAAATSGQEAIEMYKRAMHDGEPFDLVIMDMTIPGGIGGLEAIKDILACDPHARAIVSSGYSEDPVMAAPANYGFCGAVAKPYTPRGLLDIVTQALT